MPAREFGRPYPSRSRIVHAPPRAAQRAARRRGCASPAQGWGHRPGYGLGVLRGQNSCYRRASLQGGRLASLLCLALPAHAIGLPVALVSLTPVRGVLVVLRLLL